MALAKWQELAQPRLRDVIRLKDCSVATAEKKNESTAEGVRYATYILKTGEWSVPAVVCEPAKPKPTTTTILFADTGKEPLGDVAGQSHLSPP